MSTGPPQYTPTFLPCLLITSHYGLSTSPWIVAWDREQDLIAALFPRKAWLEILSSLPPSPFPDRIKHICSGSILAWDWYAG